MSYDFHWVDYNNSVTFELTKMPNPTQKPHFWKPWFRGEFTAAVWSDIRNTQPNPTAGAVL